MTNPESFSAKVEGIVADVTKELERACQGIEFEKLDSLDFADVLLGLLARAYQLWVVAVLSLAASTAPVAPLVLRALADSIITTAWITANPESASQYKLYSAGRLKLLSEHWRARSTADTREFVDEYADQLTEMADTERWTAVLAVDLGNWTGKDIRTMAAETGLKDLYDLSYSPMSADAHGEWMVLRKNFMRLCAEPLHPTHWLPLFERPHRITNFASAATDHFAVGATIALDGLRLEYRPEFWDEIRTSVRDLFLSMGAVDSSIAQSGRSQSPD